MDQYLTHFSDKITLQLGDQVAKMHGRVGDILRLESGVLDYYLVDEVTEEQTLLFTIQKEGMIIGWEALHAPGRYITDIVVKSEKASFSKMNKSAFLENLNASDLISICQQLYYLLETSFYKQSALLSNKVRLKSIFLDNYFISQEATLEEKLLLLRSSPFFGEFTEEEITEIAKNLVRREYGADELIYDQDHHTEGLFVLIQGEVSIRRAEKNDFLELRSISSPGYIFGWSDAFFRADICRATTEQKSSIYFIESQTLAKLLQGKMGMTFYKTLIWLIGNQIQLSQSRYLHLLDDRHLISVKHLIDTNRPSIPLPSPLHQIPHLLKDTSTQPLAFAQLHQLFKNGTKQERHLSSIALDLLKREERETLFLERIADTYNTVSKARPEEAAKNRKKCAAKVRKVFELLAYHLEGMENLPEKSGNIFIYNHLINHPDYTLNNRFQLTLDSHFISSLILDQKYGDPGMRTVRIAKSFEYGHQDYYENLGYINVYTKESDLQSEASREKAKTQFYAEAERHLKEGTNIIVSPEGTSYTTEESPGPFKMGPFNLASHVSEEPYLVPIVFCNFDKRINDALLFCRILKPFKISACIQKNQSLKTFVASYQKAFSDEVGKARIAASKLLTQKLIL